MVQPILKNFTVLETAIQIFHFFFWTFRHFYSLTPKMELKWAYRRLSITQMADFDFLGNY